jgi:glycosidase
VFYEVFVRSFSDSDADGIGDLAGLTAQLDYLNDGDPTSTTDLGATGIWLMPVAEAASYHGYDVVDYDMVERDYGDAGAMRAFVEAAHARGILVIVDFVINHTSRDHPWFQDALAVGPHRDWYVWSDEDPGWPSVAGPNPWHRTAAGDYYYGAFWEGMPDLNLRNPDVTAELVRIATRWLDEVRIDGFRIDAAKHLIETAGEAQINTPETKKWLADFRSAIHREHPDALVLGEVYDARAVSSGYTREGALDMAFDFGVGPALTAGVYGDAATVHASLEEVAERYEPGAAGTFLANHDQPRVMTALRGDLVAAREAAAALLTGPGVPFLYYGEELGMVGTKPDEQIRTPFPWTSRAPGHGFSAGTPWEPFAPGPETANVATLSEDEASLLSSYRRLVQLRAVHDALATGSFHRVKVSTRSVAASIRATPEERLLVLQNLGRQTASGVTLSLEAGPLCGAATAELLYRSIADGEIPLVVAPTVTATGGLEAYSPIAQLPARTTFVIDLGPATP